jgi:hypothetical protein
MGIKCRRDNNKENYTEQITILKKDKESLSSTIRLIRDKMLAILSGMTELIDEEPQQQLLLR